MSLSLRPLAPLALVGCVEASAAEVPSVEMSLMQTVREGIAKQAGQTLLPKVPLSKLTEASFLTEHCGSTQGGEEILKPAFWDLEAGVRGAFQVTGVERADQMQKQAKDYLLVRTAAEAPYDAGALRALAQTTYELQTASDDTVRVSPRSEKIVRRGWSDKALVADHPVEHRVAADLELAIGAFNSGTGLHCHASDFFVDRTPPPVNPPSLEKVCQLEGKMEESVNAFEAAAPEAGYAQVFANLQYGIHELGFEDEEEQRFGYYKNYLDHYDSLCASLAEVAALEREATKEDPRWAAMGAQLQAQHAAVVSQFKEVYGIE